LAVGDDDDDVRTCLAEERLGFGSSDFFWLQDWQVGGKCGFLYRRKGDFLAAAARSVGLGDYGHDFEVGMGEQALKGCDRELGSAAKEKAHSLLQKQGCAEKIGKR
jgi:hypothetical protein